MKKCYKGINGNGMAVIQQLEKGGGVNRHQLEGSSDYRYYFIDDNGLITYSDVFPNSHELAELPKELPLPREVYVSDESVADAYFAQEKRTLIAEVTIRGEMFYVCENKDVNCPILSNCPILWRYIAEFPEENPKPEQTFTELQIKNAIKNIDLTIEQFILEKLKQK